MTINSSILLIILLALSQTTRAEGEGKGLLRLFTTVQERAALNAERLKSRKSTIVTKTVKIKPPKQAIKIKPALEQPKPPEHITFNGLILGNNREIVWINNSTDLVQQGFRVELDKLMAELSVAIILSNSQQKIFLKPGQTLNTIDGTIK